MGYKSKAEFATELTKVRSSLYRMLGILHGNEMDNYSAPILRALTELTQLNDDSITADLEHKMDE